MFEIPELVTLARQINQTLSGKIIARGQLGNSPHKFVWYNHSHEEFEALTHGKTIGRAYSRGKWLFVPLDSDYLLVLGEFGGKLIFHQPGESTPEKYHLFLTFADGSMLTGKTQMWGAYELYETGREQERQYIHDMRTPPNEAAFTREYFNGLIDSLLEGEKRSVKGLLVQDQLIPGLGNAIAQDILFRAGMNPRRPIGELDGAGRNRLYDATAETLTKCIDAGGRNDEVDLYDHPGGYVRLMDAKAVGRPCPLCDSPIQKMAYLGGSNYFCPTCQAN